MAASSRQLSILQGVSKMFLATDNAKAIEFRDRFDKLNAIIMRFGNYWDFVTREDDIWKEALALAGYREGEDIRKGIPGSSLHRPGQIRVIDNSGEVILDTAEATIIEFRDAEGSLVAVVTRHFSEDMWIFVTKNDKDWESHLVRLGYKAADIVNTASGIFMRHTERQVA